MSAVMLSRSAPSHRPQQELPAPRHRRGKRDPDAVPVHAEIVAARVGPISGDHGEVHREGVPEGILDGTAALLELLPELGELSRVGQRRGRLGIHSRRHQRVLVREPIDIPSWNSVTITANCVIGG
jgi:hypothetical protein